MTISRFVYRARTGPYTLSVLGGGATLDESWSPYAQATITVPIPAQDVLDALDPRTGARVRFSMSQRFGTTFTLADVTAGSGSSTAEWTASFGGSTAAWTALYSTPFNADGSRPSRNRLFDLGVRSYRLDRAAGTVSIDLASDEALLQDYALATGAADSPTLDSMQTALDLALGAIGASVTLDGPDVPFAPSSTVWEPGQTAWDYLSPLLDVAGYRLWCDEARVWHADAPLVEPTGDTLTFTGATATAVDDVLDREDQWADAVVVRYRWTDTGGVDHVRYDVARDGEPTRTLVVEYDDRPFPGPGGASVILARARQRGRVQAVTAVSDPLAAPGMRLDVDLDPVPPQTGMVTRVIWSFDDDTMQARSRDLTAAFTLTP